MTNFKSAAEKIAEAVFLHGKNTPSVSFDKDLPKGQMTIAGAVEALVAAHEKEIEVYKTMADVLYKMQVDRKPTNA